MRHAAAEPDATRRARGQQTGSRAPRLAQLPYAIIAAGAVTGLTWMAGGERHVRSGTLVLAGVLLTAAAVRLVLPDRRAGMLVSRRRFFDVVALAALGVGLLVAGLVFPASA